MSVQVKTPTKNQFEHLELQCGERNYRSSDRTSLEGAGKIKDDLSIKNEHKFSQPWNRRRRYSQSYHREREEGPAHARRKRLKSSPYFDRQLPTRFLNGGTIEDPLNLTGLESSELGKQLNSVTPQSSPLPVPRRQSVELRIPVNVTDPLNLTGDDEGTDLDKLFKKKKQRHNRHKKKDDFQTINLFSPPKNIAKDKNLMEALKIEIDPEINLENKEVASTSKDALKARQVSDKIVSPVVRQISPKSKKRRRKSDNKPESSTATRSLLNSNDSEISPSSRSHKKFKHPKPIHKQQTNRQLSHNHKHQKFIYGNYNRYYGYRNPSTTSDQRLSCLNADWFDGKSILDIGCNVGHMTLSIARDFHPNKIVGIDIDQRLIGVARKNIRYYMSLDATDIKKFPISTVLNYGPIEAPPVPKKEKNKFPHNIMFMQGNYVLECDELLEMQKEEYDVIMALSITKWVHFNWGDTGLKRFFKRVFKQLRPGGRFVLEPQPWSSYKKKKKLTDEIFKNFQNIKLRPEQFNDYLLSKDVGFSTCNKLEVPMHSSRGFCRPIMVYTKSDTVQNSPYPDIGDHTPVYTSYVSSIAGRLQPLAEVSESSSCSSCDSSLRPTSSITSPAPSFTDLHTTVSQKSPVLGREVVGNECVEDPFTDDPDHTKQSDKNEEPANDHEKPMDDDGDDKLVNEPKRMEESMEISATNDEIEQGTKVLDDLQTDNTRRDKTEAEETNVSPVSNHTAEHDSCIKASSHEMVREKNAEESADLDQLKMDAQETGDLDELKRNAEETADIDKLEKNAEETADVNTLEKNAEETADVDKLEKNAEETADVDKLKKNAEVTADVDKLERNAEETADVDKLEKNTKDKPSGTQLKDDEKS